MKVKLLSRVWLFATPWTAHQAPLSMGFSRQEYWSGLPFPPPGDLPNPGIKPRSPALQADALTSEPPGLISNFIFSNSNSHTDATSERPWDCMSQIVGPFSAQYSFFSASVNCPHNAAGTRLNAQTCAAKPTGHHGTRRLSNCLANVHDGRLSQHGLNKLFW